MHAPPPARLPCFYTDDMHGIEGAALIEHDIELDVGFCRIQSRAQYRHRPASDTEGDHLIELSRTTISTGRCCPACRRHGAGPDRRAAARDRRSARWSAPPRRGYRAEIAEPRRARQARST